MSSVVLSYVETYTSADAATAADIRHHGQDQLSLKTCNDWR